MRKGRALRCPSYGVAVEPPSRIVSLVLVTPDGRPRGRLAPFPVESPWWPDVAPIVRDVRGRLGLPVTILRMLEVEPHRMAGGHVTYLAESDHPVALEPWTGSLDDHPLRQTWARTGGPAADLEWVSSVLSDQDLQLTGPPQQVKSWNLSSLWRLPTTGGQAWLKVVPPFMAHEGRLLTRLAQVAGHAVPRLLGHEGARSLMGDVPGEDMYEASGSVLLRMVTLLVELQCGSIGRVEELMALGLPDWRAPALAEAIASVVERTASELDEGERRILAGFVRGLDERFAAVADCALPDALVHGDFHPGNLRSDGTSLVLLDWGDSGVGHPLLDRAAFLDRIPAAAVDAVAGHWDRAWREAVPGCDPARVARLLDPVAAARQALIYRRFLDEIEPSEYPYHQRDPADWLRRTVTLVQGGDRPSR